MARLSHNRGRFITFEGGDGSGKSTQVGRLAEWLTAHGLTCVQTREPGGTPFAERLRRFILEAELPDDSPLAEALLFSAARTDHVRRLIVPALARGDWVLCDRFADSTRAYQGAAGGADDKVLQQLERMVVGPCQPDLTLVLDLDPALGRERIGRRCDDAGDEAEADAGGDAGGEGGRDDPFETRDVGYQQRLRARYLKIAQEAPQRCVVIDASGCPDDVAEAVRAAVTARLGVGFA